MQLNRITHLKDDTPVSTHAADTQPPREDSQYSSHTHTAHRSSDHGANKSVIGKRLKFTVKAAQKGRN